MWKCSCGTENSNPRKRCYLCMAPKDVETLPLGPVCIFIAFLIAFATMLIDDAYQIPGLLHYGGIVSVLLMGFGGLIWARAGQKSGLGDDDLGPIKKEESPIAFWFDITVKYAAGIYLIVYAVLSFLFPSIVSLGY